MGVTLCTGSRKPEDLHPQSFERNQTSVEYGTIGRYGTGRSFQTWEEQTILKQRLKDR